MLYKTFHFVKNNIPLENAPECCLSLRKAGSMRFRWNEINQNRNQFFENQLLPLNKTPVPVELNHTKIVYDVSSPEDTFKKVGDGIITKNKSLVPVITVADCVPIWLYDSETGVFGVVHSGWKGTGIITEAVKLSCEKYHSKPENFSIVIGPHIHDCCYIVNEERALYFTENFGDCVTELSPAESSKVTWNCGNGKLFRLSLLKANLNAIKKAGVPDENIWYSPDCTSCNDEYGSNRRETALNGKDSFTVMAAFIKAD